MEVILASRSPRRLQLLQAAGLAVEVMPSHVDETAFPDESVEEMTLRLCQDKAMACPVMDRPVIAADTLVSLHGEPLGQPHNMDHAREMIRRLSGESHAVFTAVCVRLGERKRLQMVRTDVHFRALADLEIEIYLNHNDVLDKAGAYAIQAGAASFIRGIEGPLDNVIGLPVAQTLTMLGELCVEVEA